MAPETGKPRIAYILLWFPLASETFIFREVELLRASGLDIRVYSMYGKSPRGQSQAMRAYSGPVCRFGPAASLAICRSFARWLWRKPGTVIELLRRGLFRKMRNLEAQAENSWCFLAGFLLADRMQADAIAHIHAPWANGPATAAWVAATLAGSRFSFTGRAGDIYPEDGILAEKAAAAMFIRTNNASNVPWLASFCPKGEKDKVRLVYNSLTFAENCAPPQRPAPPPYRILAVGRFARTKGFPELMTALCRLKRERFPVRLTLVGDGAWKRRLLSLRKRLNLEDEIDMPGFVPNDQLAEYMRSHHLLVVPSVVHANGDRDGIPNVIMEASVAGLPVVATDVCGISEVIKNGSTGLLTCQRDAAGLAQAIRSLLVQPERASAMAQAAGALVREMFNPARNTRLLGELYANAAQHGHA
ncbi:MAG: glycosyltransferase family 4 protein [Desulfovibrio sp.]|nr:glycosyltransferase family 4 protein [Desulfovibrio sp.]